MLVTARYTTLFKVVYFFALLDKIMPGTASYGLHFASISDRRLYLLVCNEIRANLGQIPERHTNGYL